MGEGVIACAETTLKVGNEKINAATMIRMAKGDFLKFEFIVTILHSSELIPIQNQIDLAFPSFFSNQA